MHHASNQLAIPAGYTPPTQLPGEFGSLVELYEIVDSLQFPGYVYLVKSYLLTESVDDDKYNAVQCERIVATIGSSDHGKRRQGPALVKDQTFGPTFAASVFGISSAYTFRNVDNVFCIRCLSWPPQAADWPIRHGNHGWPDSATVDRVVNNGCDVVGVAHRQCRQDEWMSNHQCRLSYSRAEIALINSWTPDQQIVYHILRRFVKTERLTDSASSSGTGTLSNYHIKTLMLWACELKSRSWWTGDSNLIRICVELLNILVVWLADAHCPHYFINNCNLFDHVRSPLIDTQLTVNRLMSVTRQLFREWCIIGYIYECAEVSHSSVRSLLQEAFFHDGLYHVICLRNALSAIVKWRRDMWPISSAMQQFVARANIMIFVSRESLTLHLCLCCMNELNTDQALWVNFTAAVFLNFAYKTAQGLLTDEMLDVLATVCLQSNDARRCLNARHNGVLSLSQAAASMKVVANTSCSTVQLIHIELAKAYLHKALKCKDSDSSSIYCLANVYLAVLYYTTGQYQTATDHCTLVTGIQDHTLCSSHVVQGDLLPIIDDKIYNILGLAVFYKYIRTHVFNGEQEREHLNVFTTELFAYYLYIKSVANCSRLPQVGPLSLADAIQRYRHCFCTSSKVFVTDVIAFHIANGTKCIPGDRLLTADKGRPAGAKSLILRELDTSKLSELLQQSAVEHLTIRELAALDFLGLGRVTLVADFKELYAYKCGHYERCLQLSLRNVRSLVVDT